MIGEEIQPLGDTMQQLYEEMITLHNVVVPFHAMQKRSREKVKVLKVTHAAIDVIQELGTKYKNAPPELVRKIRQEAKLERVEVRMLVQGNKQLHTYVANTITAYSLLYHFLYSLVRVHKIHSLRSFVETKGRKIVRKEIEEFSSSLRHVATKEDLEITRQNIQ